VLFEVGGAVVECDLLAGADALLRPDPDAAPRDEGLGVGAAGVVDVAGEVRARAAVEAEAVAQLEEVLAAAAVGLLVRDEFAQVLDDAAAGRDVAFGEEAEPRSGALHLHVCGLDGHGFV